MIISTLEGQGRSFKNNTEEVLLLKGKRDFITDDFALYEKGREYNRSIGLYENINRNERFYRGDQWNGVESKDLPTPVFNLFRRIINYFISTIMAQKISLDYSAEGMEYFFGDGQKEKLDRACRVLSEYLNYRWERDGIRQILSDGLLDAAVTGDMVLYVWWDQEKRNMQGYHGDFVTSLIDSANVFFGDVNTCDVEAQPYVIISGREQVERLREEAALNGISRDEIAKILPDSDSFEQAGDFGSRELDGTKCTSIIKLYKKNGTVRYSKSCAGARICPERDTGLKRYPIVLMNWERVKNSYHGQAAATGLIDNQIYINKAFAMVMKHMMDLSFSKVMYNSMIIDQWTNEIGEAIAVNGPVDTAALRIEPGSMQSGFLEVIRMTVSMTKDLMGATDAALGNVKPENTSAIIALQQSSAIPLENQKMALFKAAEQLGMIWLDFILNYYDSSRLVVYSDQSGTNCKSLDLDNMKNALFTCKVRAGASAYWSEVTSVNTLDKLLSAGHISFEEYLERIPDGFIPEKAKLIERSRIKRVEEEKGEEDAKEIS